MTWRWLVNGLGGLVGMMLSTFNESTPIEAEHLKKLETLIEKLTEIKGRLQALDSKGRPDDESTADHAR